MKTQLLLILVLLMNMMIACKDSGGAKEAQKAPDQRSDQPSNGSQPSPSVGQPQPSATPWTDHSYRNSSPYGTVPTMEDCAYIAKLGPSINETWYFAGMNSGNQSFDLDQNKKHHLRFENGAFVFRDWNDSLNRYVNRAVNNELFIFGDCQFVVIGTYSGVQWATWQGVLIQ